MAPKVRLTYAQRAQLLAAGERLAALVLELNDRYPFPADRHHLALEDAARALLGLAKPKRVVRQKARQ